MKKVLFPTASILVLFILLLSVTKSIELDKQAVLRTPQPSLIINDKISYTVDLNREKTFQPVHTEICKKRGFAIFGKFEGSKPFLGLGRYKSNVIEFKLLNVFPKNSPFEIYNVKMTDTSDSVYDKTADLNLNIILKKRSKTCNIKKSTKIELPKGNQKFKKYSRIQYHIKLYEPCSKDSPKPQPENYRCDSYVKNDPGKLNIGEHICSTVLTY